MKRSLAGILTLYFIMTMAYSIVNPLFEAPDEHWHYFTVQYIADTWKLPFVATGDRYNKWLSQEAAQPPLYYLLGAALIAPVDTNQATEQVWFNPWAAIGNAEVPDNINQAVHASWDAWPWHGVALAVHLLRGLSALFGLGTLLCIYGSGRLLWPDDDGTSLLATSLIAFLPQFNFVQGSVSNDPLITFLSSFAIWQLLRMWTTAVTRPRLLLLGITIGLAALTKNTGILLLLYALGFLVFLALRNNVMDSGDWRLKSANLKSLTFNLLLVILVVFLLGGWLWRRNWALYGDWTATNQFVRLGGGDRAYTLWQVLGESDGLWLSLIAVFGWFNVRPPDWIYWIWNGMAVLAIGGGVARLKATERFGDQSLTTLLNKKWVLGSLLATWVILVYAGLAMFMLKTEAAQGRLLFPALVPLGLGFAYGLSHLSRGRQRLIWPVLAFITTIYALFGAIQPTYTLPKPVTAVPPPSQFGPVNFNTGDGTLQLIGMEVPPDQSTTPGGLPIEVTLYWQAASPVEKDYLTAVHLLGREFESVGSINRYPVKGMLPTSLWQPGQIWRDVYHVSVNDWAAAPSQLRISVSMYDSDAEQPLPATWANGASADLLLVGKPIRLEAKASYDSSQREFSRLDIPFDENITLAGYRLVGTAVPGQTLSITLYWQAAGMPTRDYTIFVQLLDPHNTWLAGGDAPPVNNFYPTSMWQAGDFIDDLHTLILPSGLSPGPYKIHIGLYDPITGVRLTRLDIAGDAVEIPIEVSE